MIPLLCLCQNEVTLSGYIYDSETNQPLPYVNIGFVKKAIGTVSNDYGQFNLTYTVSKINANDQLQISSIGYETLKMKASEFYKIIVRDHKIYLKPTPYTLDQVVISNDLRKEKHIGSLKLDEKKLGYWLNPEALGGEIATKISIKHKRTKLHDLKFNIVKNESGSIKIRVNIYEYKNGMPGKNLLTQNIYHTIRGGKGVEMINLEPYDIYVDDDIVVSLELVKVFGKYINFEIGCTKLKSHSFTRHLSHDTWKKYPDTDMAFRVRTSYPSDKGKLITETRKLPETLTLYWDTSARMNSTSRNINKELKLLEKYIDEVKYLTVKVVKFNTNIVEEETFIIKDSKSLGLLNYLKNTNYSGEANFKDILKDNTHNSEVALLFSSGNTLLEQLSTRAYLPTFSINSQDNANHKALQSAASYAEGHYLNLNKYSIQESLKLMLIEKEDDVDYTVTTDDSNYVLGKILRDTIPVSGAYIQLRNSNIETTSNFNGTFKIKANKGDILTIDALGMKPKNVTVDDTKNIAIQLTSEIEALDEVLLEATVKKESKKVMTPYGLRNEDAIGYATSEITDKDINSGIHTLDQVIAKLPGVLVMGIGAEKRYVIARNTGSSMTMDSNPIIVIDDMIYEQSRGLDQLPPIDMQNVKSVKVLKSIIASNRYGSMGAYGAIIIRTHVSMPDIVDNNTEEAPSALLKHNDYTEDILISFNDPSLKSSLVRQLENSSSLENAKVIYKNQSRSVIDKTSYWIDAADYFVQWDKNFALSIATNILVETPNNVRNLRALAYFLEQHQYHQTALKVYEHIVSIQPNAIQSYRDLALSYEHNKMYPKALELYKKMLSNTIEGVNFKTTNTIIANEFKHFVASHQHKIDTKDIPKSYLTNKFKFNTRIVLQWNVPRSEFQVQYVNPQKKFFNWNHTLLDNKERLINESVHGYAMEEHVIDKDDIGQWIINLQSYHLEQQEPLPAYLKYTVYKNYGQSNETKEIKVIKLNIPNKKLNLDTILIQ